MKSVVRRTGIASVEMFRDGDVVRFAEDDTVVQPQWLADMVDDCAELVIEICEDETPLPIHAHIEEWGCPFERWGHHAFVVDDNENRIGLTTAQIDEVIELFDAEIQNADLSEFCPYDV